MLLPVLIPAGIIFFSAGLVNFLQQINRRKYQTAAFVLFINWISAFTFMIAVKHEVEGLRNLLNLLGAALGFLLSGP